MNTPVATKKPRLTTSAMRPATTTGGAVFSDTSTGSTQASGSGSSCGVTIGQSSTRPGTLGRALSWTVPTAESSNDRPLKCAPTAKVASTAESTAVVRVS